MTTVSSTELFSRPVFEIWRDAWSTRDGEMVALLARADALLAKRRAGFLDLPFWPHEGLFPPFGEVFKAFAACKPGNLSWVIQAEAALDSVRPLLDVVLWPKWIYLERAFDVAARTGDLVTAALVLREMTNELAVLEGADAVLDRAIRGSPRRLHAALGYVLRHLSPAVSSFVQMRKQTDWPPSTNLPEPEELLTTYQRLCDYVHPNYGSHLAFAFPERSEAGKVLLQAVITIYERFLTRDRALRHPGVESLSMPLGMPDGGDKEHARFVDRTLPWLDASAERVESLSHTKVRRTMLEDGGDRVLEIDGIASSLVAYVGDLWNALDPGAAPHGAEACLRFMSDHPGLAPCPVLADWESLLFLRRSLTELEQSAAALPPGVPDDGPYDGWFELVRQSATAVLETTCAKIAGLRVACMRMLNDRNPVGAAVVARSMLEQYALGIRVAERFSRAWEHIEEAGRSNHDMRPAMRELEQQLGRFLAGTRGTVEGATRWRERWAGLGWMNLRSATEESLETLPSVLYDRITQLLKSDVLSGGALFLRRDEEVVKLACKLALDALCELDPTKVAFTLTAAMMRVLATMDRNDGPSTADSLQVLREAVRDAIVPTRLVKGRDYQGKGDEDDPIRFRLGLVYHIAFAKLAEQLGLDTTRRRLWSFEEGIGDVVGTDGADVYFSTAPAASE